MTAILHGLTIDVRSPNRMTKWVFVVPIMEFVVDGEFLKRIKLTHCVNTMQRQPRINVGISIAVRTIMTGNVFR